MAAIEQMINNVDTKNQSGYVLEYRQRILSKARVQVNNGAIVLNIGCGEGWDNIDFAQNAKLAVGIDIEPSYVWNNIENDKIKFIKSDAQMLPFKSNSFDVIFIKDVLHHLDSPSAVLEEIQRITKNNGIMYFIEANRYNPISYLHMTLMRGHNHLSQKCFKRLVSGLAKDCELIYTETHVFPFRSSAVRKTLNEIEDLLERVVCLRKFLSYNIAVVKKEA